MSDVVLVDTGVWIDHFRTRDPVLVNWASQGRLVLHPYVLGELALGHLRDRDAVLALLRTLPALPRIEDDDVIAFVTDHRLAGSGIGWVDASLLAAVRERGATLWTRDTRLQRAAERLGLTAAT